MNQTHSFDTYILKHNLIRSGMKIVVGLSGGPDSVFLLHMLAQRTDISLIAAHLDHEWRANSADDVEFCRTLCTSYGIPFVAEKLNAFSTDVKYNGSKEEFGRRIRRLFFEKVRNDHNAEAIALAHHLDDQEETYFIRLIRGTSLSGLTVMRPRAGLYIRPLLQTLKQDIVAYLDAHGTPYLIDPTNDSPAFLRNRIRSTVIPALRACDPRFDANFLATIERLHESEQFLETLTRERLAHLTRPIVTDTAIDLAAFHEEPMAMRYRLLMTWLTDHKVPFPPAQAFLEEMLRFFKQPGTKRHTMCQTWSLVKNETHAWLDR